jgi:hypothetical protein
LRRVTPVPGEHEPVMLIQRLRLQELRGDNLWDAASTVVRCNVNMVDEETIMGCERRESASVGPVEHAHAHCMEYLP